MTDAVAAIHAAVAAAVTRFGTTIDHDHGELGSAATPYWCRTAILFRIRLKRSLIKLQVSGSQ